MTTLGLICPPDQPPERLREVATAADETGVPELWLWEDCFAPGGMTTAAVALATTAHLRVGVGLFPAPLRNVALTAMETATLARMFPDRLLPGIGHGVQSWMGQAGCAGPHHRSRCWSAPRGRRPSSSPVRSAMESSSRAACPRPACANR